MGGLGVVAHTRGAVLEVVREEGHARGPVQGLGHLYVGGDQRVVVDLVEAVVGHEGGHPKAARAGEQGPVHSSVIGPVLAGLASIIGRPPQDVPQQAPIALVLPPGRRAHGPGVAHQPSEAHGLLRHAPGHGVHPQGPHRGAPEVVAAGVHPQPLQPLLQGIEGGGDVEHALVVGVHRILITQARPQITPGALGHQHHPPALHQLLEGHGVIVGGVPDEELEAFAVAEAIEVGVVVHPHDPAVQPHQHRVLPVRIHHGRAHHPKPRWLSLVVQVARRMVCGDLVDVHMQPLVHQGARVPHDHGDALGERIVGVAGLDLRGVARLVGVAPVRALRVDRADASQQREQDEHGPHPIRPRERWSMVELAGGSRAARTTSSPTPCDGWNRKG